MRSCLRPGLRHRLAQPHPDGRGRKQRLEEGLERGRIVDHADGVGELHHPGAIEAVEPGIEQRRQDLAGTVGAEVEHQQAVAVLHAGVAVDHRRPHEFVVEARGVALVHRLGGRACALGLAFLDTGIDHGVVGKRHALPALVAIHRIVAAGDGGKADGQAWFQSGLDMPQALMRAARRHVPSVQEGVDPDRNSGACDAIGQRDEMVLMRMHAARRGKAHQMAGAAGLLQGRDQLRQDRAPGQRPVGDGIVDARQVRHGDPAGAEVHVADLGIAHLALGQADEGLRGIDQRLRAGGDQAVIVGLARVEDGVVARVGAVPPAVENTQHGRAGTRRSDHQEAFCERGWARSTALNLLGQERSRGSVLGFWSGTSMAQNTNSPRGSPSIVMS